MGSGGGQTLLQKNYTLYINNYTLKYTLLRYFVGEELSHDGVWGEGGMTKKKLRYVYSKQLQTES